MIIPLLLGAGVAVGLLLQHGLLPSPVAFASVLTLLGVRLPVFGVIAAVAIGASLGFVLPDRRVRKRAAERRSSFRHALAGDLDLVTILLAGGAHMETALVVAARTGDGWSFSELRRALESASVHLSGAEAEAEAATEQMTIPTTVLEIGFAGFLLIPPSSGSQGSLDPL